MKISISMSNFLVSYGTADRAAARIRSCGFDGVDYPISRRDDGMKVREIFSEPRAVWVKFFKEERKRIEDNGLTVVQTHATFPQDYEIPGVLTENCFEQMKREIEAAALLGSPYIVIHPMNIAMYDIRKDEEFKANIDAYARYIPTLEEYNVKIGIENMWIRDRQRNTYAPTGCGLAEDLVRHCDAMTAISDRFAVCLDTGHIYMMGYSPANAVRMLGKRLELLHVQDNYGNKDAHKAPGQGAIDWNDFAEALKEVGYKGAFNMELELGEAYAIGDKTGMKCAEYAYTAAAELIEKHGL